MDITLRRFRDCETVWDFRQFFPPRDSLLELRIFTRISCLSWRTDGNNPVKNVKSSRDWRPNYTDVLLASHIRRPPESLIQGQEPELWRGSCGNTPFQNGEFCEGISGSSLWHIQRKVLRETHWVLAPNQKTPCSSAFRGNRALREPYLGPFPFSVATPAEPRGEKKLFFVQILGGEKLLKFVEKCRWNIFKRPERG